VFGIYSARLIAALIGKQARAVQIDHWQEGDAIAFIQTKESTERSSEALDALADEYKTVLA
jgi:hypothetical protein